MHRSSEFWAELRRMRPTPRRLASFARGQFRIRRASLGEECHGAVKDIIDFSRGLRGTTLIVAHTSALQASTNSYAIRSLVQGLLDRTGAIHVRSRVGYRLHARKACSTFSLEPYLDAPPVRFAATHKSLVFVGDIHSKRWMARHLRRSRVGKILTPFLWQVEGIRAFRAIAVDRWQLFPWWVPDEIVERFGSPRDLDPTVTAFGAIGLNYELREWIAQHPETDDFFWMSRFQRGATRIGGDEYFRFLRRQSAVVVAVGIDEWMRAPVKKYVEVPACGALLIGARAHHLSEMGFVDGVNCLLFEGQDDYAEVISQFRRQVATLSRIALAGTELVRRQHTTSVRLGFILAYFSDRPDACAQEVP
jgi:hypothetical protein